MARTSDNTEYFIDVIPAVEADEHAVTLTVVASPEDDRRVTIELKGRTDASYDGPDVPLIEIIAFTDDQLGCLIDALQNARNYMRAAG